MISRISGKVIAVGEKHVVIDVGGVGYKIFCTADTQGRAALGGGASLFTYLSVREDALDLYGFSTQEELDFFELLISVSGIGPKGALGILGVTTIETLKKAIATGDTSYLTKVSGIGRKTAEKIVLELRDKLSAHGGKDARAALGSESDAVEALKSLGYSAQEARDALRDIDPSLPTNTKVKSALRLLAGK